MLPPLRQCPYCGSTNLRKANSNTLCPDGLIDVFIICDNCHLAMFIQENTEQTMVENEALMTSIVVGRS